MHRKRLRDLSIVQNTPNSEEANSEQQTVIGSSNVPEILNEPAEFQTESGGTRRGRGCTLLKDLYDLNPVEHVKERFALESRMTISRRHWVKNGETIKAL
ncbi:hypothetical protein PVK06_002347 [Gossypium arboreum]|uniref:Uncharacterized protein n=1 Tax=Gossypium arboreum TaxID=29729 RepID=A0ABR0R4I9_GOSAR|nr:hypothetical protein PVK06_002347 [Gossypium arboreum]